MSGIRIISTGGTIANTPGGRLSVQSVLSDLTAAHPDAIARGAIESIEEVLREGGETFTPTEWVAIIRAVQTAVDDDGVDGVIVTHGTYTAEETAYALHLAVRTDKPVVVVCSQRKHGTLGNDGDRNLADAVRLASDPAARGLGVTMLLGEEVHSAREVTKTNQRPGGFRSGSYGILGSVEVDRVNIQRVPRRRHTATSELMLPDGELPRVDIVATYAGADGAAVDAFVAAGAEGIVVHGFSFSGKPHHLQKPALVRAIEAGVAVVLTNRGGDGRVPVEDDDGFVRGDSLTSQKARVLLTLALGSGIRDQAGLQCVFDSY